MKKIDNRTSYDTTASIWHQVRNKMEIDPLIVELCALVKKGSNILDVGCGGGTPIAKYLVDNGFIVKGIDISKKLIDIANRLKLDNATFINIDFFDFIPTEKYDCVIAFNTLFHFPYQNQRQIYPKISNLLNKGGYFLFTHGKVDGEIIGVMFEQQFYYSSLEISEVISLLKRSNFKIIKLIEDYKFGKIESDLVVIAQKI